MSASSAAGAPPGERALDDLHALFREADEGARVRSVCWQGDERWREEPPAVPLAPPELVVCVLAPPVDEAPVPVVTSVYEPVGFPPEAKGACG